MNSEATIYQVPTRSQIFAFIGFIVVSIGAAMAAFPFSTVVCFVFAVGALLSLFVFRIRIDPQGQWVIQELRLFNFLTVWNRRWSFGEIANISCVKHRGDPDGDTDTWYVFLNSRNGRKMVVREYGTRPRDEEAAANFAKEFSAQTGIAIHNEAS